MLRPCTPALERNQYGFDVRLQPASVEALHRSSPCEPPAICSGVGSEGRIVDWIPYINLHGLNIELVYSLLAMLSCFERFAFTPTSLEALHLSSPAEPPAICSA